MAASVVTTTPSALVSAKATAVTAAAQVPQSPTAVNDGPFTVTQNTPLTLTAAQLVGNDTTPNTGDVLGVSFVGGATTGTVVRNANGTVTYTPPTGYTGTASFIYNTVDTTNGYTSTNFAAVSLTVTATAPVNQAPTAVNDGPFTVTNNTPLTLTAAQLVGNDTDPNTGDTLSVSSITTATNGTAVLNTNGTVTFTPTTGYAGTATFGYKVKDAAGAISTNTATVSLTVTAAAPVNQAPTAVNDGPFTVTQNTPLTLTAAQLVGNDTDPNTGDTLSVSSITTATNGTAVLNTNGTVTFTPTTGYAGTATFGYKVKDAAGAISTNTATVSLTVTAAAQVPQSPTAVNDGPFTVTQNTPLTLTAAQLVGNDTTPNTGDVLGVSFVGGATTGTVVRNANGTVTYTPPTGYTGTASFIYNTVDTTNGYTSTNFAAVSLTVTATAPVNQAPTAVNDGPFTVTNNTPLTLTAAQLVGNDTDPNTGDTLSVSSITTATNGTAVLNTNGTVTFTPTTGYAGTATFGYKVKDAAGAISTNTATVSLTVTAAAPVNQAPTAVNDGPFTVTQNTPLTLTAAQLVGNDTDPNTGDTLSVSSITTATNGTAVLNTNGTVTFTPTTGYAGTATFGYKVKDAAGAISTNTATVSLTVTAAAQVPQSPTAVNDGPFTVTQNTPLTLTAAQLVGNDTTPNTGDVLGVSFVGGATTGTVVRNANGTVTYTPPTGYTGTASFIYNTVDTTNGYTSTNFAAVSLTVTATAPVNQAPTAVNDGPFTVTNNTPLTLTAAQLVGNDTDPNTGDTLSVSSITTATNGTAVLNTNGTVTFTPTTGYAGTATFGYKVKDAAGAISTNTATVSLTVTATAPVNQAPTAVNDGPFTVTNNTPLTLTAAQLVGNDTDPNTGDTLSVSSITTATNGTAVLNTNGTVTFTPTTGYAGTATFGYKVKDAAGAISTNTATVSLTVTTPTTGALPINTSNTAVGFADSNLYGETNAQINTDLDNIKALGVNEVRILIPWAGVEPTPGADNWATVDYIVSQANARGISILGVINSTPAWAIPAGSVLYSTPPTSNAAFASFAGAVAARYAGQISAYEVWNEPNTFAFWSPTPSAADYTKLLQAAYPAIKAADPNATVVAAGLISVYSYQNLTVNPIDYISQMYQAGAQGYFDAVAIHPYQYTLPFSQGGPYGDAAPINQVAAIHALMVANGDGNKLIWSTEYGDATSVVSEATQASIIQDYLTSWSQLSYAGPSFIYTVMDTNSASTNDADTLGVVRSDGTYKPAAYVIQQWTATHPQQVTTSQMMAALTATPATSSTSLATNPMGDFLTSCQLATAVQNSCTAL